MASLFGFMSFLPKSDYAPMRVFIKGKILNLKTGKPLKKTVVHLDDKKMDEIDFYPEDVLIDSDKTNNNGDFLSDTYVDKNDLQFWLKIEEFAQLNVLIPNLDTTKRSDTIDLGNIYFVSYNNELEVEEYNMPKSKKKKKEKYEKYSIAQVDSIFNLPKSDYGMELNPIDTINGLITRYSFGPNNPRGTTIKNYKQLTFKKIIK
ncbi:MAG: hypothetical protein ACPGYY_01230 [Bacteroidia bacterium]